MGHYPVGTFSENVSNCNIYLASAGDIGGMMGKKFGLGWSLDLPVMRQYEDMATDLF